jgi:divalent metal cation (Fe/Co/Zn/Cd) transporter
VGGREELTYDAARRAAVRLSCATVGWNAVVGGAAVATALVTGSLSLIGFGGNAIVDSAVSVLLVWRFRTPHDERATQMERLALRVAGTAFVLVALYLVVRGSLALAHSRHASFSVFGVIEAAASVLVLPYLAVGKYRVSVSLGSRALRADSLLTTAGVALAGVTLGGLLLQRALGWWWADPVAALAIATFLADEGRRTLRGDED